MNDKFDIGKSVKEYLEKKGIKQTFLAKETGIRLDALSSSLNGRRALYAFEFYKICKVLNEPMETFVKMEA